MFKYIFYLHKISNFVFLIFFKLYFQKINFLSFDNFLFYFLKLSRIKSYYGLKKNSKSIRD